MRRWKHAAHALTVPVRRGRRRRSGRHHAGARPAAARLRGHAGLRPHRGGDPHRDGDVEPDHLRVRARGGGVPRRHGPAAALPAAGPDVLRHPAAGRLDRGVRRTPGHPRALGRPAAQGARPARGDRASGREGRGPQRRRRGRRGPRPHPRPGGRLHRPRGPGPAVRDRRRPHAVRRPAAGRGADLPDRRRRRTRPAPGCATTRWRASASASPAPASRWADRATSSWSRPCPAVRSTCGGTSPPPRSTWPGCARRSRSTSRRRPSGSVGASLADGNGVLRGELHPRRTPPRRHPAVRGPGPGDGRRGGAQRPAHQPGLEQRDQVRVVLPGGDHRPRRAVRRRLDAAHLRPLLARLGAVGVCVDQLLAAALGAAPARGGRRGRAAPRGRRADRGRLRRRPAVQPVVVRRRRGPRPSSRSRSPPSRPGSTRATCAGRSASTPPA